MFHYEIISSPCFPISESIVSKIFSTINKKIGISQQGTLNIVFVSAEEIKNLNKKYRNKNKETDVLSFHYYEDFSKLEKQEIAWEIILCEEKIIEQGKGYWLWEEKEFYKLLIHSILHILWFDHEQDHEYKIMQEKEDLIWKEVFEK